MEASLSKGVWMEEINEQLIGAFASSQKGFTKGFVRFQPYNQVLPRAFARVEKRFKEFKIREDDVWIGSFPKCGTTWAEEMVWCIMNDLDFEGAKKKTLDERIPYFDLVGVLSPDYDEINENRDTIKITEHLPSPRIIKTHLSLQMLPTELMEKKAKIIYLTRNPRDTCVSLFHHWHLLEGFTGSFDTFVSAFLDDVAGYCVPFFAHVLEYWNIRNEHNVLFLTYEEMQADLPDVINRVVDFLGRNKLDDDKVKMLAEHLSFDKMRNNSAVNKEVMVKGCIEEFNVKPIGDEPSAFMRQGKSGNWKKHLTPEMVQRFEAWENKWLEGSGMSFMYEV